MKSICGIDCTKCGLSCSCSGCLETGGRPFGEKCIVALYCQKGGTALSELKETLIAAFNELSIEDMEEAADVMGSLQMKPISWYPNPASAALMRKS